MRGREQESEAPRFEDSPAYRFAEKIHRKNPHLNIRQLRIDPLDSASSGSGQHMQFEHQNKPWVKYIVAGEIMEAIEITHAISWGELLSEEVHNPSVEVVVGSDDIVRWIHRPESDFDLDTDEFSDTQVGLMSEASIRNIVEKFENDLSDAQLGSDDIETIEAGDSPATGQTIERLKVLIEKISDCDKIEASKLRLGESSFSVVTIFKRGDAAQVNFTIDSSDDSEFREEAWQFRSSNPSTFKSINRPQILPSDDESISLIKLDLAVVDIANRYDANQAGGNLATPKDVDRGLRALKRLSRSFRKKYEKKEPPELDDI